MSLILKNIMAQNISGRRRGWGWIRRGVEAAVEGSIFSAFISLRNIRHCRLATRMGEDANMHQL